MTTVYLQPSLSPIHTFHVAHDHEGRHIGQNAWPCAPDNKMDLPTDMHSVYQLLILGQSTQLRVKTPTNRNGVWIGKHPQTQKVCQEPSILHFRKRKSWKSWTIGIIGTGFAFSKTDVYEAVPSYNRNTAYIKAINFPIYLHLNCTVQQVILIKVSCKWSSKILKLTFLGKCTQWLG